MRTEKLVQWPGLTYFIQLSGLSGIDGISFSVFCYFMMLSFVRNAAWLKWDPFFSSFSNTTKYFTINRFFQELLKKDLETLS